MPTPHPSQARKRPTQARSKVTVECILAATAQVLEKKGMERLTTTLVAERAGVSVGTLYQYFPTRAALVAALIESQSKQESAMIADVLDENDSLETMVEKVTGFYFGVVAAHRKLFVPLIDALYSVCHRKDIHRLERNGILRLENLLKKYGCQKNDLHQTAFIFYYTSIGLLRFAALVEPDYLGDPNFLHETIQMLKELVGVPNPKSNLKQIRSKTRSSSTKARSQT